MITSNKIVANAIDYSRFRPKDKWEVLDDIDAASDASDMRKIKPYAQKYGVMADFERACKDKGIKV